MSDDRSEARKLNVTYQKIFQLKFEEDVPTYELGRRFPKERRKISRVALLELSRSMLCELVKKEKELQKLLFLKQWFFKNGGFREGSRKPRATASPPTRSMLRIKKKRTR